MHRCVQISVTIKFYCLEDLKHESEGFSGDISCLYRRTHFKAMTGYALANSKAPTNRELPAALCEYSVSTHGSRRTASAQSVWVETNYQTDIGKHGRDSEDYSAKNTDTVNCLT